jgi:hypothetical protein
VLGGQGFRVVRPPVAAEPDAAVDQGGEHRDEEKDHAVDRRGFG